MTADDMLVAIKMYHPLTVHSPDDVAAKGRNPAAFLSHLCFIRVRGVLVYSKQGTNSSKMRSNP